MNTNGKTIALLILALLAAAALDAREPTKTVSQNPQAQALIDKAWAALDQEMNLPQVDAAIGFLEQAVKLDPHNQELLVELADEYYQHVFHLPLDTDEQLAERHKWFSKGLETARRALEIKETAAARYWTALHLSGYHEDSSVFSKMGMAGDLLEHIGWIDKHEPGYKYGGHLRLLSVVARRVPAFLIGWAGQDLDELIPKFNEAIAAEPRFLENYRYKAMFLRDQDQQDEALNALAELLRRDPEDMPNERAYNRMSQRKARELWKQWTGKDYPQGAPVRETKTP